MLIKTEKLRLVLCCFIFADQLSSVPFDYSLQAGYFGFQFLFLLLDDIYHQWQLLSALL